MEGCGKKSGDGEERRKGKWYWVDGIEEEKKKATPDGVGEKENRNRGGE